MKLAEMEKSCAGVTKLITILGNPEVVELDEFDDWPRWKTENFKEWLEVYRRCPRTPRYKKVTSYCVKVLLEMADLPADEKKSIFDYTPTRAAKHLALIELFLAFGEKELFLENFQRYLKILVNNNVSRRLPGMRSNDYRTRDDQDELPELLTERLFVEQLLGDWRDEILQAFRDFSKGGRNHYNCFKVYETIHHFAASKKDQELVEICISGMLHSAVRSKYFKDLKKVYLLAKEGGEHDTFSRGIGQKALAEMTRLTMKEISDSNSSYWNEVGFIVKENDNATRQLFFDKLFPLIGKKPPFHWNNVLDFTSVVVECGDETNLKKWNVILMKYLKRTDKIDRNLYFLEEISKKIREAQQTSDGSLAEIRWRELKIALLNNLAESITLVDRQKKDLTGSFEKFWKLFSESASDEEKLAAIKVAKALCDKFV